MNNFVVGIGLLFFFGLSCTSVVGGRILSIFPPPPQKKGGKSVLLGDPLNPSEIPPANISGSKQMMEFPFK